MTGTRGKQGAFIALALLGTSPAAILATLHLALGFSFGPGVASLIFGLGIISAAFLIAWGAEAAQRDISGPLALALVAVITILPEYAVDFTLAWKAGYDPVYAQYAVANMTGANRLLIGIAWPLVVVLAWFRTRAPRVRLRRSQAIEVRVLAVATLYAFTIPLKRHLDLLDTVVLISLFVAYMWLNSRADVEERELFGPAALVGSLPTAWRRSAVLLLFIFPAAIIFLSAEPFAEGLIEGGKSLGVDEFLLIQWVAPLASEAPEIVVASIFVLRGSPASALGMLVSAEVNQWTLLVGSLPVVYSVSVGAPAALPLDGRQMEEVLLTAAQSLFAVALLASLFLSPRAAVVLFLLFIVQFFLTDSGIRYAYSGVYLGAAVLLLAFDGRRRRDAVLLPSRVLHDVSLLVRKHPKEGLLESEPGPPKARR